MNASELPVEAEVFLKRFRQGLGALEAEEREELVKEVRTHLRDRHASGKAPLLQGFDDPQTYASQFVAEAALRGALARGTSLELGRALLTGTKTGLAMLFLVAPLLITQLLGAALVLAGALKPFVPSQVGLFLDHDGRLVALGVYGGETAHLREMLGLWAVPVFVVTGVVLLWAGNQALRAIARWKVRSSADSSRQG